jgi:hypothetical protein
MLKWDRVLYGNEVLSEASRRAMMTPHAETVPGSGAFYGYGLEIGTAFGHRRVHHSGGINGFIANFERFVDDDVTIVALGNVEAMGPIELTAKLAAIVFGASYTLPELRRAVELPPEDIAPLLGRYALTPNAMLRVTTAGDKVYVDLPGQPRQRIFPESQRAWFWKMVDAELTFQQSPSGAVTAAKLRLPNGAEVIAPRLPGGTFAPPKPALPLPRFDFLAAFAPWAEAAR